MLKRLKRKVKVKMKTQRLKRKKLLVILLAFAIIIGMIPMTSTKAYAADESDTLPDTWSNIAHIEGLSGGYWPPLKGDNGTALDVSYILQNNVSEKGQQVDTKHIKDQYVTFNGHKYNLKNFKATQPGTGELTTTWDNGHKEVDGFGFYTFVTVNYRDVDDSKEALAPMQYKTITMTEYDPDAVYNVSAYDKKNIEGYQYLKTDGILTGKVSDLSGQHNVYVYYKKLFTVTYKDGTSGAAFQDQIYTVPRNDATPEFNGTPIRDGYRFIGWDQSISDTVTGDVIYTAQWEKLTAPTASTTTDTDKSDKTAANDKTAQTGDSSQSGLWIILALASALGLTATAVSFRRKHI